MRGISAGYRRRTPSSTRQDRRRERIRRRLRALWDHLRTENTTPGKLALAVGLGLFVGVLPLYGLHTFICLGLAFLFRLNKLTMVLASQISLPIIAPFLVAGGVVLGELLRFGELRALDFTAAQSFLQGLWLFGGDIPDKYLSCFIGDTVIGVVLGGTTGALVYAWARWRQKPTPVP